MEMDEAVPERTEAADVMPATDPTSYRLEDAYRKYGGSLFWVCRRYTRQDEDAEDLVQETFMKAEKAWGGFRGESGLYTWLYRIAVNQCLQWLRRQRIQPQSGLEGLPEPVDAAETPEGWEARLVLEKISSMTDPQTMEILFLLYQEKIPQEEVARMLDISRSTVVRKVNGFRERWVREEME